MHAAVPDAIDSVLSAARRKRGEPAFHGHHRPAVPRDAVVWVTADGPPHATGRTHMWATPGAAADETGAAGPHPPKAKDQQKPSRAQDIPISSQRLADHPRKPGLVHRHYPYPDAARISLPGGHHGLVQPQGAELAAVEHHGRGVLYPGTERSVGAICAAGDLQL